MQKVLFGRGKILQLNKLISELQIKNPMIVTGQSSYPASGAKEIVENIFSPLSRFVVTSSLPTIQEVERGLAFYRTWDFDAIIGIGGGCVLDTAKLIRFFGNQNKDLALSLFDSNVDNTALLPLIAIPTSAGSGAEATHFAVIYQGKKKHSIAHKTITPNIALVDPDLTLSVSSKSASISGLDILAQGMESYWSVNATTQSKNYARKAIKLAADNLIAGAIKKNIEAKENLSLASLLAGQAINISKTTAPHALSYTLSASYGIPHGHAVALTLGEFFCLLASINETTCNHPAGTGYVKKTLSDICQILEVPNVISGRDYLSGLITDLGIEHQLSSFGIHQNDLEFIVDNINYERLANHPQKLNKEILMMILNAIM